LKKVKSKVNCFQYLLVSFVKPHLMLFLWHYQVLFANLKFGICPSYHPQSFWRAFKDYDGLPVNIREHQDAYEFFTRLQDLVDFSLMSSGQTPALQLVLGGMFVQQIICKDVEYRQELLCGFQAWQFSPNLLYKSVVQLNSMSACRCLIGVHSFLH
jgi:hypothetical protein